MNVIGFAGFSGSGKTTLVEQLIPELRQRGQRVSVVKHAHHKFDVDHPGKDTWRHRAAGAFEVVAASDQRLALMREFEQPTELSVHHLLAELYQGVDWVLVEGFKECDLPKIEIWRAPTADYTARPAGYPGDAFIVAESATYGQVVPVLSAARLGQGNEHLAVFFPSLVFGWLRERTGTIVAPTLYHAACNIMVLLTAPHFF